MTITLSSPPITDDDGAATFECSYPLFQASKQGLWYRLRHGNRLKEPKRGVVARDVAWLFGTSQGAEFWLSIERPLNVIGPARSGKGVHIVVNAILDAPGAVITSSTRDDNLRLTALCRATRGPVHVFNLDGVAGREHSIKLRCF